jgi:hypothetical protein
MDDRLTQIGLNMRDRQPITALRGGINNCANDTKNRANNAESHAGDERPDEPPKH